MNRNSGMIDYKLFIKAIIQKYGNTASTKALTSRGSFKIYHDYVEEINKKTGPVYIRESIINSMKFIISYCTENNIKDFDGYLYENQYLIPTIIKHLKSGSVSVYFVACINNFNLLLKNYSQDVLYDYMKDFDTQYQLCRMRVVALDNVKDVLNKADKCIDKILKEKEIKNGVS